MGKSRKRRRSNRNWFQRNGKYVGLVLVGAVAAGLVAFALNPPAATVAPTRAPEAVESSTPEPDEFRGVFIGDSYTQGTGASSAETKWTALLSAELGLTQVNLGRGGTGYVTTSNVNGCGLDYCPSIPEMVPEVLAASPSVVFVGGGQNDVATWAVDSDVVTAAITATFQGLRAELPDTLIVGVGPSIPGVASEDAYALDAAVREAVTAIGGTYVSLLDPVVIDPDTMVLPDRAHVNDSGHAAIAARISSVVASQVAAVVQP